MNQQDILTLCKYNAWSNAKILNAASGITQEQFCAPVPFPHGSLQGTLMHALFAEWLWRNRWEGTAPASTFRFKPEEFLANNPAPFPFLLDEDRRVTKAYGVYHRLGLDAPINRRICALAREAAESGRAPGSYTVGELTRALGLAEA